MADTTATRKRLLEDKDFVYVPACSTDIRRTFRKHDPHWPFGQVDPAELRQVDRDNRQARIEALGESPI